MRALKATPTAALIWMCVAAFAPLQTAWADSKLIGVGMDSTGSETLLRLRFSGEMPSPEPRFVDKRRIILDLPDMDEALQGREGASGQEVLPGEGVIRQLRYARRGVDDLRVVLDLSSDATVSGARMDGDTYVMSVTTIGEGGADGVPVPRLKPTRKAPARPVVVIDAGHGGRDPGAIGTKGLLEKDVTSSAADMLAKRLGKTGRYEVVLTRDKDVYIAHEERLKTARLRGADLFISIHADSAGNASASGASVYTLSDRAVGRSRRLVQSQNWIMDVDLAEQSDAVGDILVDLAQRKTHDQSDAFAEILLDELGDATNLVRNSHRRAGYFVLLAPDVPAVLLELGFLSNADDERKLKDARHRETLMRAVADGIDAYFGH